MPVVDTAHASFEPAGASTLLLDLREATIAAFWEPKSSAAYHCFRISLDYWITRLPIGIDDEANDETEIETKTKKTEDNRCGNYCFDWIQTSTIC